MKSQKGVGGGVEGSQIISFENGYAFFSLLFYYKTWLHYKTAKVQNNSKDHDLTQNNSKDHALTQNHFPFTLFDSKHFGILLDYHDYASFDLDSRGSHHQVLSYYKVFWPTH